LVSAGVVAEVVVGAFAEGSDDGAGLAAVSDVVLESAGDGEVVSLVVESAGVGSTLGLGLGLGAGAEVSDCPGFGDAHEGEGAALDFPEPFSD
jgi:hypothetical protein